VEGWEAGLGSFDLAGKRAVVSLDLGSAIVEPRVGALVLEVAEALIALAGLNGWTSRSTCPGGTEWVMGNVVGLRGELGDRYPECNDDLTPELQFALNLAAYHYNAESGGAVEQFRMTLNERMADLFEQADFIVAATNPDVPFPAGGPMPTTVGDVDLIATYGYERASATTAS